MAPMISALCCGSASHPHKPDGKWSWLVCFAGSFAWALSFGMVNSYAVVMPVIMNQFRSSREGTAWAGSIPSSLSFACIPICSKVVSYIGIRLGALVGTVMCALSLVLTSFTTSLIHVFFSYSILFGVGCSMIFTSSVQAMTKYFIRRQGVALGFLTGGPNLAVLVLGPLLQELIGSYGFRTMYQIVASFFVVVFLLVLSYDPNVQHPNDENLQDGSRNKPKEIEFRQGLKGLSKNPIFVLAVFSLTLQTMTGFVTHVHLVSYCKEVGIPPSTSSKLYIAIGLSSLLSSLIAGRVVDIPTVNPLHVNQAGSLVMALSMLMLQLATEYYHFVIYSVFLGLGCGVLAITLVILLLHTVQPRLRSVAFPIGQLFTSLGNLTGPPLIGFIADKAGSYKPAFFTAGGICLVAFFLPFLQYWFKPWREPIRVLEVGLQTPSSDHDEEAVHVNGPSSRSEHDDSDTIPLNPLGKDVKPTSKPEQLCIRNSTSKVEKEPLLQNNEPDSTRVELLPRSKEAIKPYESPICNHSQDQDKEADKRTPHNDAEPEANTAEEDHNQLQDYTSQKDDKKTENHVAIEPSTDPTPGVVLSQDQSVPSNKHQEEIENPDLQAKADTLL